MPKLSKLLGRWCLYMKPIEEQWTPDSDDESSDEQYRRVIDDKSYNLNTWTSTLAGLLNIPLQPNYMYVQ